MEKNRMPFSFREGSMSKLSDLINAEDSFLVKLRCENTFDETKYLEIKNQILIEMPKWRAQGFILNCDVEVLISLIDQLAGGSRFFSEETAIRVEDACMEIEEIINCLGS
jgi:hypothetical protein